MTVFLYPSADAGQAAYQSALAFTHGDHYKPVPGYQVMNHHYHMDLGQRLGAAGSLDADIPDLVALKALGINIVSQIDSVGGGADATPEGAVYPGGHPVAASRAEAPAPAGAGGGRGAGPGGRGGAGAAQNGGAAGRGRGGDALQMRYNSIEGARRHSDSNFLVMPNQEYYGSPLGGHTDLLFSHAVYWTGGRAPDQPLVDNDPKYGKVYHIGSAGDLMEMARREDVLINMPHPRTKGSTGYPGFGQGPAVLQRSALPGRRFPLGHGARSIGSSGCARYRCQPLLDDMNNWVADKPIPPKYILSISEVRHQQPGDEIYASSPVTYVKLDVLPPSDDASPVIQALMRGDSFVTSGEVLIPTYAVQGTGAERTIVADVEWTFPLNFVEVVWGDGTKTDRQVDLRRPICRRWGAITSRFRSTRPARRWVRFAAWDSAGNGAMSQPIKLSSPTGTAGGR